jgi:hypothetical protein
MRSKELQGFSTLKDINQYHHDRDDQENVYESSHRIRGDQTKKPEDNQNDRYGPEHFSSPPAVIHAIDRYRPHRCLLFSSSFNPQADAFSDTSQDNPARQPSVSASVRNASRRLS